MKKYVRSAAVAIPPVGRLVEQRDRLAQKLEAERETNRRLKSQVEALSAAAGRVGDAPDPASYRYLFVVTYGRSGSTLLQGILNSIPGYTIRGENGAAIYHLYKFHQTMAQKAKEFAASNKQPVDPTHPWYGMHEYEEYLSIHEQRNLILDTVLRPEEDTRVVGFKEVRWYWKDTPKYVEYLRKVFPYSKFLFNTRSHDKVANSKWWAERPEARAELERIENLQLGILADLRHHGYHVHYDDWVADPSVLQGMYDWLGEPFDLETVKAVMAQRHSY
ncbi:MAG: sulfotransferase [Candidatus Nanopelagicales bacterium]